MVSYIKTAHTQWPADIPDSVKSMLEAFYQLLDGGTADAAKEWSKLWIPDVSEFHAFGQIFRGHQEIAGYLSRSQSSFPGLIHTPKKVYIHDKYGTDLTVITGFEVTLPNGKYVYGEAAAVLELVRQEERLFVSVNRLILVSLL